MMKTAMITCCELLIAEHRRTERFLAELESALIPLCEAGSGERPQWLAVYAQYEVLAHDLYRHFVLEERALFSLLSPYRTMMLMEVEHDDLLALQKNFETLLKESLSSGQAEMNVLKAFQDFKTRLSGHILEEERGVFPMAEQLLLPEEKEKSRQLYEESLSRFEEQSLPLLRTEPAFQVLETRLSADVDRPLGYETLFSREHSEVQHIRIQAGARQNLHWVGPHQFVVVFSGAVELETKTGRTVLKSGDAVTLDSRLYFSFHALTDTHLLAFKVWPHPHYTKSSN